ncbi:hypothetical protein CU097_015762 [Rhizopus azygosporus]|uniref:Uncharacterized protein n=1 Tax=Rhizopus azygosporus TaxID=86630 RepID=A0A367KFP9_RHIAZ|nr:hypothetical protein CU097_015762 [Rhizopus azygosporus]
MTDEDNSTRQRLLNGMVTKLKTKLLCRKVFVSPCSSADMEFSKRDTSKKSLKFMESFKSSFMIDLLLFLKAETRMVRLIAIDYAGLSTNVEDLRSLVNFLCLAENNKRRIAAKTMMDRKRSGEISDIKILYDQYEFGAAEVNKTETNDIKELNGGSIKLGKIMKTNS